MVKESEQGEQSKIVKIVNKQFIIYPTLSMLKIQKTAISFLMSIVLIIGLTPTIQAQPTGGPPPLPYDIKLEIAPEYPAHQEGDTNSINMGIGEKIVYTPVGKYNNSNTTVTQYRWNLHVNPAEAITCTLEGKSWEKGSDPYSETYLYYIGTGEPTTPLECITNKYGKAEINLQVSMSYTYGGGTSYMAKGPGGIYIGGYTDPKYPDTNQETKPVYQKMTPAPLPLMIESDPPLKPNPVGFGGSLTLIVGQKVTFSAFYNPEEEEEEPDINYTWKYSKKYLDCQVSDEGETLDCISKKKGNTQVYVKANIVTSSSTQLIRSKSVNIRIKKKN